MTGISRRSVLKGIAGGVVAAAAPGLVRNSAGASPISAVVIGSGITGLAAAYELQRAGFAVTVFEKDAKAGGRMREDWVGPIYGPVHAVTLWSGNREMWDLAAEAGLGDAFAEQHQPDYPLSAGVQVDNGHGRYGASPRFDLAELQQIPGMSDETRSRLADIVPDLDAIQETADPCLLRTGTAWDDESFREYCTRKLGETGAREFIDYWAQRMWLDTWDWDAQSISRVAVLPFIAQREQRWVYITAGIGLLPSRVASALEIRLNTTVMRVTAPDETGRHTVHYLTAEGERTSVTPDVVVCATEGNYVLPMVQGLNEGERGFFEQIHMLQTYNLSYLLKPGAKPRLSVPDTMLTPNHPDSFEEWRGYDFATPVNYYDYKQRPSIYFALSVAGSMAWRESGKSLADYCLPLVQRRYAGVTAEDVDDVVVHGGDYVVNVPTGYPRAVAGFLEAQEAKRRGLYFTGEYLGHTHTGGACASGRTVGRSIVRHWS